MTKKGRNRKGTSVSLALNTWQVVNKIATEQHENNRSLALENIIKEYTEWQKDLPPYLKPTLDRYAAKWQTDRAGALARIFEEWEQSRTPVAIAA